jgi:hypothetical protein
MLGQPSVLCHDNPMGGPPFFLLNASPVPVLVIPLAHDWVLCVPNQMSQSLEFWKESFVEAMAALGPEPEVGPQLYQGIIVPTAARRLIRLTRTRAH